jgi:hypothetical protein
MTVSKHFPLKGKKTPCFNHSIVNIVLATLTIAIRQERKGGERKEGRGRREGGRKKKVIREVKK